jgi:hypothetical protein
MKKIIGLIASTACLLAGMSGVVFGKQVPPAFKSDCVHARDKAAGVTTSVFESYAEIDESSGPVEGLTDWFCVFNNQQENQGMIDLQTLGSVHPSFGATYLLKGLDLDEMGYPDDVPPDTNPASWVCEQILGTSITRYANGGFTSPPVIDSIPSEDEVCVFADGSKISGWVLIYVSLSDPGPNYLSMRKAVQSEPLDLELPYLGDLPYPVNP